MRSRGAGRQAGRLAGRLEERERSTNHLNIPATAGGEQARESRIVQSWEANLFQKSVTCLVQTWYTNCAWALTCENFGQIFADGLLSRNTHVSESVLVRYVNKQAHRNHLDAISTDAQTINMTKREEMERNGAMQSDCGGKSEAAEGGPGEGDVLRELGQLQERVSVMHEHLNFISTVCAYVCHARPHIYTHTSARGHIRTPTRTRTHTLTRTHCPSLSPLSQVVLQIAQAQGLRHIGAPSGV